MVGRELQEGGHMEGCSKQPSESSWITATLLRAVGHSPPPKARALGPHACLRPEAHPPAEACVSASHPYLLPEPKSE